MKKISSWFLLILSIVIANATGVRAETTNTGVETYTMTLFRQTNQPRWSATGPGWTHVWSNQWGNGTNVSPANNAGWGYMGHAQHGISGRSDWYLSHPDLLRWRHPVSGAWRTDTVHYEAFARNSGFDVLRLNGSDGYGGTSNIAYLPTWTTTYELRARAYFAPVVTANPSITRTLGNALDLAADIRARWGYTSSMLIPNNGSIVATTVNGGAVNQISGSGTNYDRIGVFNVAYVIKDSHSLSSAAQYAGDNTFVETSRNIVVRTLDKPILDIRYNASAVDDGGTSVAGQVYNKDLALNPCGGELGWTNQSLNVTVGPGSLMGLFDSVLYMPDAIPNTIVSNAPASYNNYHNQSPDENGTTATGVLTEINNIGNELTGTAMGVMKIDKTPPVAGATHEGGFSFSDTSSDGLSGLSVSRPSLIAIVPTGTTPVSGDYELFTTPVSLPQNYYDVYVWATDKAGNKHIEKIFDNYMLGGEVTVKKDTDQGSILHVSDCPAPNNEQATINATCTIIGCIAGANADIMERSDLIYKLELTNTNTAEDGVGSFVDYLPKGVIIIAPPTFSGNDPSDDVIFVYGASKPPGPYEGQIKLTGTYTIKSGSTIEIEIPCKVPLFDKDPSATNIISNQATLEWTLGTGISETTGTYESNYANHQLLELPSVETKFKKVGFNDLDVGLVGTEFVLYKWTGTDGEYTGGNHNQDIIDKEALLDGKWQRVKKDGENALLLTDAFVSDGSGIVDLGDLPSGIYTLIETKTAPTYELPIGQWILTVDATNGDNGTGDWKIEFVGKSNSIMPPAVARVGGGGGIAPEYKILNAKPFVIGLTGLGGTTSFLLIGISLMLLAGVTYTVISNKKKKIINQ